MGLVEAERRLMVTFDEPVKGALGGIISMPEETSEEGNAYLRWDFIAIL